MVFYSGFCTTVTKNLVYFDNKIETIFSILFYLKFYKKGPTSGGWGDCN